MQHARLPKTCKRVTVGDMHLKLHVPDQRRQCAPCVLENNLCCEGNFCNPFKRSEMIHLRPTSSLTYPAITWLRERISEQEWNDFIADLDRANLEGTVKCQPCLLFPCAFPCFPCQPCCCFLPLQYEAGQFLMGENALNLSVARFNRYLFLPRGIVVRRQFEYHKPSKDEGEQRYVFLRFDFVPPGSPITDATRLPVGLQPGAMQNDIRMQSRKQFLQQKWPMSDENAWCAWSLLVPDPQYFFAGSEPEIGDTHLVKRYGKRNAEYAMVAPNQVMYRL